MSQSYIAGLSWSHEDASLPVGHVDDADHLLPHQRRVIDEKLQLDDKIGKLSMFHSDAVMHDRLDLAECARLGKQLDAMREYSEILAARISAF